MVSSMCEGITAGVLVSLWNKFVMNNTAFWKYCRKLGSDSDSDDEQINNQQVCESPNTAVCCDVVSHTT